MNINAKLIRRSTGFWLVVGFFLLANGLSVFSALRSTHPVGQPVAVGFPFPAFIGGVGADGSERWVFFWSGLLLDIAVPITMAVLVVWLLRLYRGDGRENT